MISFRLFSCLCGLLLILIHGSIFLLVDSLEMKLILINGISIILVLIALVLPYDKILKD